MSGQSNGWRDGWMDKQAERNLILQDHTMPGDQK